MSTWEPKQERSRDMHRRLLFAAWQLVREKGYEGLTVPEIAARAGASTGAFYRRFPSKDAMLEELDVFLFDRSLDAWRTQLAPGMWEWKSAAAVVAGVVQLVAWSYQSQQVMNRSLAVRWRTADLSPAAREAAARHYREIAELVLDRLAPFRDQVGHPDPRFAIAFVIDVAEATLVERVAFADRALSGDAISVDRFVSEMKDLAIAYMRISPA
ncbi:MAG TPA: TetR/AcrR family transcriptional regulator [Gaiellaceae bacterium]